MARTTKNIATRVVQYDLDKINEALAITGRSMSEFLKLAAIAEAERIIVEHKRAKRRNRDDTG